MAFAPRDSKALQDASMVGIRVIEEKYKGTGKERLLTYTMVCPSYLKLESGEKERGGRSHAGLCLSAAIEAQTRKDGDAALWLRVDGEVFPHYVLEAIQDLRGFGTRMVVTQGDACSHAPGPRLDAAVCAAVAEANIGAVVWHPLAEIPVFGVSRD